MYVQGWSLFVWCNIIVYCKSSNLKKWWNSGECFSENFAHTYCIYNTINISHTPEQVWYTWYYRRVLITRIGWEFIMMVRYEWIGYNFYSPTQTIKASSSCSIWLASVNPSSLWIVKNFWAGRYLVINWSITTTSPRQLLWFTHALGNDIICHYHFTSFQVYASLHLLLE